MSEMNRKVNNNSYCPSCNNWPNDKGPGRRRPGYGPGYGPGDWGPGPGNRPWGSGPWGPGPAKRPWGPGPWGPGPGRW